MGPSTSAPPYPIMRRCSVFVIIPPSDSDMLSDPDQNLPQVGVDVNGIAALLPRIPPSVSAHFPSTHFPLLTLLPHHPAGRISC